MEFSQEVDTGKVAEMCKEAGVPLTERSIRRLCDKGHFPRAKKFPPGSEGTRQGIWIIPIEDAYRFIEARKKKTG